MTLEKSTKTPCRVYEINDHLQNVRNTVSDLKVFKINRYNPRVKSFTDYYAFGFENGQRSSVSSDTDNTFGFNGKLRDKNLGIITNYDYGYRVYNPGLARFLSVDPLKKDYVSWTPYAFAMNRVIDGVDLDGLEYHDADEALYSINKGQTWLKKESFNRFYGTTASSVASSTRYDAYGEPFIGATAPVQSTVFPDGTPLHSPLFSGRFAQHLLSVGQTQGGLYENKDQGGTPRPGYRPSSGVSKSYKRNYYQRQANNLKNVGNVGSLFAAVDIGVQLYNGVEGGAYFFTSTEQKRNITNSWNAVRTAILSGMIDDKYNNIENLSQLADFVFQGTEIPDLELQNIGIDITKNITNNYRGKYDVIDITSGLDNYPTEVKYLPLLELKELSSSSGSEQP